MMSLELASIPLAFLAGILSIMSPCVGPTLGAAIALASSGLLDRWRPGMLASAARGKQLLGALMPVLGLMVFTGFDKTLEALALELLPDWAISI